MDKIYGLLIVLNLSSLIAGIYLGKPNAVIFASFGILAGIGYFLVKYKTRG